MNRKLFRDIILGSNDPEEVWNALGDALIELEDEGEERGGKLGRVTDMTEQVSALCDGFEAHHEPADPRDPPLIPVEQLVTRAHALVRNWK